MKVKELIEMLSKKNPNAVVVMRNSRCVLGIKKSADENFVILTEEIDDLYKEEESEEYTHRLFKLSVKIDGNLEKLLKALNDAKLPVYSEIETSNEEFPYLLWDYADWDASVSPTENLVDIEEFLEAVSDYIKQNKEE